jgi:hypothetical protein
MKVLFYAKGIKDKNGIINSFIESGLSESGVNFEIHESINSISRKLSIPKNEMTIVILVAETIDELMQFGSLKNLLSDISLILILPDRDEKTLMESHQFYPRFISYIDSNYNDLIAYIRNLIQLTKSKTGFSIYV